MVEGIFVSLSGMAVVFLVLAILMFLIMGLERLFRPKPDKLAAQPAQQVAPQVAPEEGGENELVAAIAVALASLRQETGVGRGKRFARGPTLWRHSGRQQLMDSEARWRQRS